MAEFISGSLSLTPSLNDLPDLTKVWPSQQDRVALRMALVWQVLVLRSKILNLPSRFHEIHRHTLSPASSPQGFHRCRSWSSRTILQFSIWGRDIFYLEMLFVPIMRYHDSRKTRKTIVVKFLLPSWTFSNIALRILFIRLSSLTVVVTDNGSVISASTGWSAYLYTC